MAVPVKPPIVTLGISMREARMVKAFLKVQAHQRRATFSRHGVAPGMLTTLPGTHNSARIAQAKGERELEISPGSEKVGPLGREPLPSERRFG